MKVPRELCRRFNPAAQPPFASGSVVSGFGTNRVNREAGAREVAAHLPQARQPATQNFRSGSLCVDLTARTVKVADKNVRLSGTEYSLLLVFVRHAGRVLTHAEILRAVWGTQTLDKLNHLHVYLRALRKKLENPAEPCLFQTEPAVGYRLVVREP